MLESDGISDDASDWGSDFDEDVEDDKVPSGADIYEVPDGKPSVPVPTIVPGWLRKVSSTSTISSSSSSSTDGSDENFKPPAEVYIEHVLLPTRATKDEDSKNFIETLKRKLSQKNLLTGKNCDPKTNNGDHMNSSGFEMKKIKDSLQKFPWFYRVDRSKAELILENYHSDGSYLVRECHHGGPNVPFTLTIRFQQRLFHIQIRIRPDSHFALGTLKHNEMHFSSVSEMIDCYKKTPLQLHSNGKFFGETKLTHPPIVYSYSTERKY
ncbi:unnamed protein product [Allacma fusca]|uniref:SH2 domain-containing protein n=1 Tax=Allacma fusca TaxID=39272 RepID=A0A8J2P254_9HEXA|nr:unnamed protein product [Allacma fusca]